jgi:heme/copper-type cytochrome/quinol oxidase subunit 3
MTGLLIASLIPNMFLSHWAKNKDLRKVRVGLVTMSILGILPLAIRAFEFSALRVWWDQNAYGSIVWTMLGLHTTHIITDLVDTLVLTALMFTRHADNPRRFGDVEDNAMYWNFVVAAWLPLYLCIYWVPRL